MLEASDGSELVLAVEVVLSDDGVIGDGVGVLAGGNAGLQQGIGFWVCYAEFLVSVEIPTVSSHETNETKYCRILFVLDLELTLLNVLDLFNEAVGA